MLEYEYTARDSATGGKVKATLQANSEAAVAKTLQDMGLTPLTITLKSGGDGIVSKFRNRVKAKDKVLFSRQLSTMINAGLPLVQSLRTVQDQTASKTLAAVIVQVINDVEGGMAFAAALEKHPTIFNTVFTSLVAAGEASGTLDEALERLANQQEKDAEIASKVRGAMVYPRNCPYCYFWCNHLYVDHSSAPGRTTIRRP